ncbi:MAG: anti-sigma factor family protein [Terriglobia bacterium]
MVCKEILRKLCDYLDGNLDPRLVEELSRHLDHCEDCNIVVDTTRKTIEVYCKSEPMALPDDVKERLDRALYEKLGWRP